MRFLRRARAGLVVAFVAAACASGFAADAPEDAAQKAAEAWVKLMDEGKYGESWDAASSLFKSAVTRDQWAQAARSVRSSVGTLTSRKLKSREFSKSLPGAPDGEYVTLQYDAVFEKKPAAIETSVVHKDTDGAWHVAGYFIK